MTYTADIEGGDTAGECTPMLRTSSEAAKPNNDHSSFWTVLHFFGGGIYAPDAATYDPIEMLLNTKDEKEKDELTIQWRDNKLSELSFIGVVAALLAGVLTSTGSWPQVLPSGRESPWPIRTAWYCGIILSLFSILTAAGQTAVIQDERRAKAFEENRTSCAQSVAGLHVADASHVPDDGNDQYDHRHVLARLVRYKAPANF
ncbi:hypothetical protein E8E12_010112 [Didymella heteroderae]|uniref:Uncharacterized protein n=1 Tax=Didymella heteroderae TaxID=1769908 RepID=A0A9P4WVN6_9PLEO|nr:hypothetical protein E8E12_010112 [Didymella heteroderae]